MERHPAVYIMSNQRNGTLYIGVTSNLTKRVWQHKNKIIESFSRRYILDKLVWYEFHETMESAIRREKAVKKWYRKWKVQVVEEINPEWHDLYDDIV